VGTFEAPESIVVQGKIAGDILELPVTQGAVVEKGTVLARLDPVKIQARLAEANASLALAKANYARSESLRKSETISEQEFDEAAARRDEIQAAIALLKSELADAVLVARLKSLPNVTIVTQAQTTEITGDGKVVNGLRYTDRASGAAHHVPLEGVFVQIGLVPNTEWLTGTVTLSRHGEIEVDARGATNVPGVFAAGDATTVPYKQIVIAAGEGAKAALSAFDHLMRMPAVVAS
jgi:multidrug efflux pump subunit AcrA (membrane-fusion protein)